MKSLYECLDEALNPVMESDEVFVVKDKTDGTIITVCDTEAQAKEAADVNSDYEVSKSKRSEYIK